MKSAATSRWWPWIGAIIGIAALAWVLRGLDLARLRADLARADVRFILLVPLAVVAEQWVRAWKWRQLLHPMKPAIQTLHLLGAIMAGYLIACWCLSARVPLRDHGGSRAGTR